MRLACHALHLPLSQWLACHSWTFKWYAKWDFLSWRVTPSIPSGTPSFLNCLLVHWRATPCCSSGTPIQL
ncbi:hypothetical protein AHAS_Ahas02G0123900 [Arachis hypogaea]